MARKKKNQAAEEPNDSFQVLFVSLNLILLSFFILLSALSTIDDDRSREAIGSLIGAFGILEGGENVAATGQDPSYSMPVSAGDTVSLIKRLKQQLKKQKSLGPGKPEASIILTADNLKVVFTDNVPFRSGGVELNPELFPILDKVSSTLVKAGVKVTVRGWADPSPHARNLELSSVRAVRVARYLIEAAGMDRKLVKAEGWGVNDKGDNAGRVVELLLPSSSLSRKLEEI